MNVPDIRSRLDHPILDGDGHLLEFVPVLRDFLVEEAGTRVAERFDEMRQLNRRQSKSPRSAPALGWWGFPAENTLDRASTTFPDLMYNRLDEIGIDFAVVYPTFGLTVGRIRDEELRLGLTRACNRYYTEVAFDHRERMEPVAVIPMRTPEEALAELEFTVVERGMKIVLMDGLILRPIDGMDDVPGANWVDTIAHDSIYDYDPVWQRCVELGVNPTFHTHGTGWGSRISSTNWVFNHVGHFAAAQEAACRAAVIGGVPNRFPTLRFLFLEGGCGWAANLCSDLMSHYEKRNSQAVQLYNPSRLDRAQFRELAEKFGSSRVQKKLPFLEDYLNDVVNEPGGRDEFAESGIAGPEDIVKLFTERFFFGCEADDPMTAVAFNPRLPPLGKELQPVFGSDVGHFDVPDMRLVLHEAWELIEDEMIDMDDFRKFTFSNAATFWTSTNPAFFKGTRIEDAVERLVEGKGK